MWRVDLPDGTYTLTQEEGAASGQETYGLEEPKASVSVESEEGKHRFHLTFLIKSSYYFFYISVFCFYLCI
jgi:hypothetical protein